MLSDEPLPHLSADDDEKAVSSRNGTGTTGVLTDDGPSPAEPERAPGESPGARSGLAQEKLALVGRIVGIGVHGFENTLASTALVLIALLPTIEVITRRFFSTGIRASAEYVQHLVIVLTFAGGMVTSREGRHLALSVGIDAVKEPLRGWLRSVAAAVSVAAGTFLAVNAWQFVMLAFEADARVGFVPLRLLMLVMPVGLGAMTLRLIVNAPRGIGHRLVAAAGLPAAGALALFSDGLPGPLVLPLAIVLVVSGLLGAPVFLVLGGLAVVLFAGAGGALAVIPNEAYTMLSGAVIPTIPLFALTGFILSESRAGERLVRFFKAAVGWLPGGLAVMTVAVCAFFTTFTGASGVTILALGALLSYVLTENRYRRTFGRGLLTASGSIGLLFPPSLPIILYGVVAHVNIKHLFIAGIVPGVLMVIALSTLGVRHAVTEKIERTPFQPREALAGLWGAAWELALPFAILVFYLQGITTLVETAAMAVVYSLLVATVVRRDIAPKEIPGVLLKCITTVGGVLVILAIARGLSYYIIDAEVPLHLTRWCSDHIGSKYVFLLLLNIALLITGCFMDIFSAIVVVVPLIVPLGEAFGIHPVHLGVIFLANLELGYLTPPVGINLFLASYRFETPLSRIYRDVLPFLAALIVAVLLITYVPWITTGLLSLLPAGW
ncbi:MAG: TRAP transporter large permease subunit [Chitinivibrionales bacterium]|nr:TRAP transporter large permease subunit [Chitinivibrionales bacterium]